MYECFQYTGTGIVAFCFKGGGSSFHVQLEQANKSFARKAVSQIEAIPELEILISLSDNSLTVHELRSLKPLSGATQSLSNTKGANVFSVDVEVCYYVTFFDGGKGTQIYVLRWKDENWFKNSTPAVVM